MRWKRTVKLVLVAWLVVFFFMNVRWKLMEYSNSQLISSDKDNPANGAWSGIFNFESLVRVDKRETDGESRSSSETVIPTNKPHITTCLTQSKAAPTESTTGPTESSTEYFIVMLIASKPDDRIYRDYIRSKNMNISAWDQAEFQGIDPQFMTFKIMFIVGMYGNETGIPTDLADEISHHNDVFFGEELTESRDTLRYKILWGMRKSISVFRYTYLVKVDHDTVIDLPHLLKGLPSLARVRIYTGACKAKLERVKRYRDMRKYKRVPYCHGGAYILSRDMVEMVVEVDATEPDHYIIPEDGYLGWLVQQGKKRHNISAYIPQRRRQNSIVKAEFHPQQRGFIVFSSWFYHWLKGIEILEDVYECRVKMNQGMCPRRNYSLVPDEVCRCNTL